MTADAARRAYQREWYEKNKEKVSAKQKAYRQANRDRIRAYQKQWYEANGAEQNLRRRDYYRQKNWRVAGLPAPTRPEPSACECCGKADPHRSLSLDHCHDTGSFRGWLCSSCNLGLGKLGDTEEALQRALDYLRRSKQ